MNAQEYSDRVRACTPRLWRIAWLILRCGADCDDALQEALLRGWNRRSTLRDEALFETWLTRILIHESNRILRKRRKCADQAAVEQIPEDYAELHNAVAELPIAERIAVGLHYMEGYRQREIAEMLGVPETVVQWRLRSARKRLKNLIENRGDET